VLADIGRFAELTRLRLSHNELTDRTVAKLAGLRKLERLNLYSNPGITDASVEVLASLPELKRLDVWNTGVTEKGMARLRELRPDLGPGRGEPSAPSSRCRAARTTPRLRVSDAA
jgi:hypothetical protein